MYGIGVTDVLRMKPRDAVTPTVLVSVHAIACIDCESEFLDSVKSVTVLAFLISLLALGGIQTWKYVELNENEMKAKRML